MCLRCYFGVKIAILKFFGALGHQKEPIQKLEEKPSCSSSKFKDYLWNTLCAWDASWEPKWPFKKLCGLQPPKRAHASYWRKAKLLTIKIQGVFGKHIFCIRCFRCQNYLLESFVAFSHQRGSYNKLNSKVAHHQIQMFSGLQWYFICSFGGQKDHLKKLCGLQPPKRAHAKVEEKQKCSSSKLKVYL